MNSSLTLREQMLHLDADGKKFRVRFVAPGVNMTLDPISCDDDTFVGHRPEKDAQHPIFVNLSRVTVSEIIPN